MIGPVGASAAPPGQLFLGKIVHGEPIPAIVRPMESTGRDTTYNPQHFKPALRGMLHAIAGIASPITGSILVIRAVEAAHIAGAMVFAIGLSLALGASALFHRVRWSPRAGRVMQRIDHSMIFVLVAATYTPFLLEAFDGWQRIATVAGIWGAALTCILLRNVARDLGRGAMTAMYLGLGWLAVAFLPLFVPLLGFELVVLIAAGGLLYTVGAVVYATRRPNPLPRYFGFHEVFHTFVIAAATLHYVAVWQLTG